MSLLKALGGAGSAASAKLYPEDVFIPYLTNGTGASLTVTTGIDLATKGGAVFRKGRSGATDWAVYDTVRGATYDLITNSTAAQTTQTQGLTAFSTTGHTWGTLAKVNTSAATYVDYVFRNADKFFKTTTKVHTTGIASTVDLSNLGTVGMVEVKSTIGTSNWFTYHRSATSGKLLYLNLINAETTDASISVSGTTLTIASAMPSDTYVVYAYAHDTSTDGIIQCGSFTTDASGYATVNLGWEPQYILVKNSSGTSQWEIYNTMSGMTLTGTVNLYANLSNAETAPNSDSYYPTATGFRAAGNASSTYIYMAIRRPMKVPTSGTEVFAVNLGDGDGSATVPEFIAGFPVDAGMLRFRTAESATYLANRLTQGNLLATQAVDAEITNTAQFKFDYSNGWFGQAKTSSNISYMFRRAKGFFDIVCYTGTGVARTVNHNLGVVPELWLAKGRSGTTQWVWGSSLLAATEKVNMPTTAGKVTDATSWNSTYPTASVFSLGTSADVNTSAATYIMYLFATLSGVSKVGIYTGNGTTQTISCGFSAGARFVLIFRTSAAGDFFIWDTVRGIVAANDPHLSLNTTSAEVTTDDSVDPEASGFIVNQVAETNINVSAATYIFLAIA